MVDADRKRELELRKMFEERRREVAGEVKEKIRESRDQNVRRRPVGRKEGLSVLEEILPVLESSNFGVQEDIEWILVEMKAETLTKINEALHRLDQGVYGYCSECSGEIAEKRLRALPFAVRCRDCQEACEVAEQRERSLSRRRSLGPLFDF